jgi:hypothetical protein
MPYRKVLVCLGGALAALLLWGCGQASMQNTSSTQGQGSTQSQASTKSQGPTQGQGPSQSSEGAPSEETGSSSGLGTRLDLNGSDLYYTASVTAAEAKRLQQYLLDEHVFDGAVGSFQLNKAGSEYQFRIVVQKGAEDDQEFVFGNHAMAMRLSGAVFGGRPVVIHLCDENFKTLRVIDPNNGSSLSTN